MELFRSELTEGDGYYIAQEITNIRKLFGVHFFPLSSIYLADLLIRIGGIQASLPFAGVTHGSRNALETILFEYMLCKPVLGTDISKSSSYFPRLIRHDMNLPIHKRYYGNGFGFVYSNSWDHSNAPKTMFYNWMDSLSLENGCLIIEKQRSSGACATLTDPFAATDSELISLLSEISREYNLDCHYVGTLELNFVSSGLLASTNEYLLPGTATRLYSFENGKHHLVDFSVRPEPRPLRHHIFLRSKNKAEISRAEANVAAVNSIINSGETLLTESYFRLHPTLLHELDIQSDIVKKVEAQVLLSMALKEKVFRDTRGDSPSERDSLVSEVVSALNSRGEQVGNASLT